MKQDGETCTGVKSVLLKSMAISINYLNFENKMVVIFIEQPIICTCIQIVFFLYQLSSGITIIVFMMYFGVEIFSFE